MAVSAALSRAELGKVEEQSGTRRAVPTRPSAGQAVLSENDQAAAAVQHVSSRSQHLLIRLMELSKIERAVFGGRNGLIPERKAGTRGYDWENGKFWSFDVETFVKVQLSLKQTISKQLILLIKPRSSWPSVWIVVKT